MPLQITSRVLKQTDRLLETEYNPIFMHGYGRIDQSTPNKGLSTSGVRSCLCIVFHSSTTGRTVMSHSPNFLFLPDSFVPIVDWVTGGTGAVDTAPLNLQLWYARRLPFTPTYVSRCALDIVVLRGFLYRIPEKAACYGHAGFMRDFSKYMHEVCVDRHIDVNIQDVPEPLLSPGAVAVDKTTGHITRITVERGAQPIMLTAKGYSLAQTARDEFIGAYALEHVDRSPQHTNIHLQYNVTTYCLSIPLPSGARLLIRASRLNQPTSVLDAIAVKNGCSKISTSTTGLYTALFAAALMPPCEVCPESGKTTCSRCRGAFYCGKVHQTADWKSHKAWCKAHTTSR